MEFASGLEHALAIKVYFKLQVFFQIFDFVIKFSQVG